MQEQVGTCVHRFCSVVITLLSFDYKDADQPSEAENQAQQLMKEKLPLYVVKCFIAAGFDTLEVIAEMNISNEAGNSIMQIENFISDEYPDDPEHVRGKKFPPGHKIRIQKFVTGVKQDSVETEEQPKKS